MRSPSWNGSKWPTSRAEDSHSPREVSLERLIARRRSSQKSSSQITCGRMSNPERNMDYFGLENGREGYGGEADVMRTEVVYASAGHREMVSASVIALARNEGLELTPIAHSMSLEELNHRLGKRPVSFIVGASSPSRMSLVDCTAIMAVHAPPLVLFHHGAVSPELTEKMRQAGVTAVVRHDEGPEVLVGLASRLARSWAWVRITLGRIDVAGAIQRMASIGDDICLTLGCPHVTPLLQDPWKALRPCRGDHRCHGWFGRVYLRGGTISGAETPAARGLAALSELMELRRGQVMCQEVFLRPAESNIDLPIEAALLHAATMTDHRHAGIEVA